MLRKTGCYRTLPASPEAPQRSVAKRMRYTEYQWETCQSAINCSGFGIGIWGIVCMSDRYEGDNLSDPPTDDLDDDDLDITAEETDLDSFEHDEDGSGAGDGLAEPGL